ncbi:MAG: glycosyltransferase family 4 protein [Candidatus Omnitrophica bacterium]|nr:glycosyltransferase family 4 protein [Candidatus Omnitrophota bacterium]
MRIIFIGHSGWDYPHTRVRCYGFAEALKKRGFDTEVLSFKDHLNHPFSEEDMYARLRDRDKRSLVYQAIRKLYPSRNDLFVVQKAHFHAAAPWILSKYFGAKYLFDYDDYDIPLSNFFARGRWNRLFFGSKDWEEITHNLASRAEGCIVSSHALEEYLAPYNSKIVRVETGTDLGSFYPPREGREARGETKPLTFLWNGIVWGDEIVQCVNLAIESFAKVHSLFPNTRLLIVGGGFQWQRVVDETLAKYEDVPITFRGWMPPEAMPSILREADVGLLPFSVDNLWFRSKSPTKLFEYMASGLAVVAWNLGEVKYVIEDGVNGFLSNDRDEMIHSMTQIAKDKELRHKLSTNARQTIEERYSHEVLGEKLADFVEGFVNKS